MALNLLIFLWVAARYEYKAVEHVKRVVLPRSLQVGGRSGLRFAAAEHCRPRRPRRLPPAACPAASP